MTLHAKIHVGCKQLGIEEDDRRDLYERITGKRSLTEMSHAEHKAVIDELQVKGFKPLSKGSRKRLEGQFAPKIQALWIAAWNLGIVRNKSDQALLAFVKRQAKVDHTKFLRHKEDADKVIEGIKGLIARGSPVDWSVGKNAAHCEKQNGYKIAAAQWRILKNAGLEERGFFEVVASIDPHFNPFRSDEAGWIPIMNALGKRVRSLKK